MKEESAKAKSHLTIKMTKIMTAEEVYDFKIDNEDINIVKDFACFVSIINSNGNCSQETKRRLRLRRVAMEELKKISKSKDVSLQTKAKIIHPLLLAITVCECES